MKSSTPGTILFALLLSAGCPAATLDSLAEADPTLHLGGFGTLGALYHTADGIAYRRNLQQPHGVSAGKPSLGNDTMVGAQINARLGRQMEAVVQVHSQWRAENNWTPQTTWAFLRLATDDSMVLRLGRVPASSQINLESRLVGYAALSIRPGQELQSTIPVEAIDGGDLSLSHPALQGVATAKVFYGTTSVKINVDGTTARLSDTLSRGLILAYGGEPWSARCYGGLSTLRNPGPERPLVEAMRAIPVPEVQAAADTLDPVGAQVRFFGADLAYDDGRVQLQASVIKQHTHRLEVLLPDSYAVTFLAGLPRGRYTPYVQWSRARLQGPDYAPGLAAFGAGAFDAPIDRAVTGAWMNQRSMGLGVRLDIADRYALKFQVDRIKADYSPLLLAPGRPAGAAKHLTLFGIALDFTF